MNLTKVSGLGNEKSDEQVPSFANLPSWSAMVKRSTSQLFNLKFPGSNPTVSDQLPSGQFSAGRREVGDS